MNGAPGPGQPTHSFFTPHQHKWMSHLAPAKKHTQDDARGHTSAHGILTLVSSCVQRRLGAELSTSSEDRHTTVYRARRASFGASSSGYRLKWRGRVSVETRTQKSTRECVIHPIIAQSIDTLAIDALGIDALPTQ
jgi:hypothetical protein